jgi:hypothetical protein
MQNPDGKAIYEEIKAQQDNQFWVTY